MVKFLNDVLKNILQTIKILLFKIKIVIYNFNNDTLFT